MFFSICVPTFNRVNDLRACFASINAAVSVFDEPVEVLISDNASTDGTSQWLNSLNTWDSLIKLRYWVNPENIGIVRNIILLAREASAKYIFYITDDDYMLPNALKIAKTKIIENKLDFFHIGYSTYLEKKQFVFHSGHDKDIFDNVDHVNTFYIAETCNVLSGSVVKNDSDVVDTLDGGRNVYPSVAMCAMKAGRCGYTPDVGIFHVWENEIHWGLDVDLSSREKTIRHLHRDFQLSHLHIPDHFVFQKKEIDTVYEHWLRSHGVIEREIENRFGKVDPDIIERVFVRRPFVEKLRKIKKKAKNSFNKRKKKFFCFLRFVFSK